MTLADIDDDLLREAETILGQKTKRGTLNAALELVVRQERAREYVMRLADGLAGDLDDQAVIASAQR
jgi:Arc/MetJ family transcription regulator